MGGLRAGRKPEGVLSFGGNDPDHECMSVANCSHERQGFRRASLKFLSPGARWSTTEREPLIAKRIPSLPNSRESKSNATEFIPILI